MKSRHIGGINDRLELLISELTELAQTLLTKQEELVEKSNSEMLDELKKAKAEEIKLMLLKSQMDSETWSDSEYELLNSYFETQKRFALYITESVQIRSGYESHLNELIMDTYIGRMKSLKHKKEILVEGVHKYYSSSGDERNRILDILYEMIENIYEPPFYTYALQLNREAPTGKG